MSAEGWTRYAPPSPPVSGEPRAGLGFLMGNAPAETLELGLNTLPTNDQDGVARAIEEHDLDG